MAPGSAKNRKSEEKWHGWPTKGHAHYRLQTKPTRTIKRIPQNRKIAYRKYALLTILKNMISARYTIPVIFRSNFILQCSVKSGRIKTTPWSRWISTLQSETSSNFGRAYVAIFHEAFPPAPAHSVHFMSYIWQIQDSSVSIERAGRPGFDSRQTQEVLLYPTESRHALAPTQPPTQWVEGPLSSEVERPGREADHSPPSSAEVKNSRAIPSLPHASSWRGAWLLKHRNNFTFTSEGSLASAG
jgi:hypothetical protein